MSLPPEPFYKYAQTKSHLIPRRFQVAFTGYLFMPGIHPAVGVVTQSSFEYTCD